MHLIALLAGIDGEIQIALEVTLKVGNFPGEKLKMLVA